MERVFYATTDDRWLYRESDGNTYDAYLLAHEALKAGAAVREVVNTVGQQLYANRKYVIYRTGVMFDTSSLGPNALITEAILSVVPEGKMVTYPETNFTIVLVPGDDLHTPMTVDDYGLLYSAVVDLGSRDTGYYRLYEPFEIFLNFNGIDAINKTGLTKFGIRSNRDISALAPLAGNHVEFYGGRAPQDLRPRLILRYEPGEEPPPPPPSGPISGWWWGLFGLAGLLLLANKQKKKRKPQGRK